MSRKKTEVPDLDVAGLLALKTYERPDAARAEKNIQSIMRGIHAFERGPSTQAVNRKLGIFAQPRYGIAVLFVLFLGLHLIDRPVPSVSAGSVALEEPSSGLDIMASIDTNRTKAVAVPGIKPAYNPLAGEAASFTDYSK